jgi:hypothetical protein
MNTMYTMKRAAPWGSPPCCRCCRWRCITFDAMFPYAQQSSINTISDRSVPCQFVMSISCRSWMLSLHFLRIFSGNETYLLGTRHYLFISSRHLVAMQNLNESAATWGHLWWWDPWMTWLHEIVGK